MKIKRVTENFRSTGKFNLLSTHMKRFLVFVFCVMVPFQASLFAQTKRINIDVEDVSLRELCEEIRQQSDYSFFLNEAKIEAVDHISLHKTDISVEDILTDVLKGSGLTYTLVDNVIIIKTEEKEEPQERKVPTFTITGTVVDFETGESIPGVNVQVKNGFLGSVTDLDGKFRFVAPVAPEILVFSFIGYETEEVVVEGKTALK